MDTRSIVRRAVTVFVDNPNSGWNGLRNYMLVAGLSKAQTALVLEFVPLAFGRSLLEGMGMTLEDFYVRLDAEGRERARGKLSDEAIYREALLMAPEVMATSGQDAFVAVAVRSSEFQAVNQALNAGADPANLQASPPVLAWTGEKPWWKFWA